MFPRRLDPPAFLSSGNYSPTKAEHHTEGGGHLNKPGDPPAAPRRLALSSNLNVGQYIMVVRLAVVILATATSPA